MLYIEWYLIVVYNVQIVFLRNIQNSHDKTNKKANIRFIVC